MEATRMARRPHRLSATFVRTVTAPGRYGDGFGGYGLSLQVKAGKHGRILKSWAQRVRIDGKESNIGLGAYPVVTLAEARQQALANRRMIAQGRDPRRNRDTGDRTPTFAEAVESVIALQSKGWKAGSRLPAEWRSNMVAYAFPVLAEKR
ncbi:MAG: DUF4102 domain-containing protein, partial [Gemmatimonadetes bacterium]|nr:DUF4102 domain-containing protein [Gemmatimonadota bacterium]